MRTVALALLLALSACGDDDRTGRTSNVTVNGCLLAWGDIRVDLRRVIAIDLTYYRREAALVLDGSPDRILISVEPDRRKINLAWRGCPGLIGSGKPR